MSHLTPNDIAYLRREAKKRKAAGLTHSAALDELALERGYPNWSMLHQANSAAPTRSPVFQRSIEEMQAAFRKAKGFEGFRHQESAIRAQLPDLCEQFANPMSALEYAWDYIQRALSLPRYAPHYNSVAYVEMRVYLPYTLEPVPEQDDCFIIVGRDYKPIGMTQRDKWVDYRLYKNLHAHVPAAQLRQVTHHHEYSPRYLYGISPRTNRKYVEAYLRQLGRVMELVARYNS